MKPADYLLLSLVVLVELERANKIRVAEVQREAAKLEREGVALRKAIQARRKRGRASEDNYELAA